MANSPLDCLVEAMGALAPTGSNGFEGLLRDLFSLMGSDHGR